MTMKSKLIGPCTFDEALKVCVESHGKYRLPDIHELETMAVESGIRNKSFWSTSEDSDGLVWIGSNVEGSFWKGDGDHETTSKSGLRYALLVCL